MQFHYLISLIYQILLKLVDFDYTTSYFHFDQNLIDKKLKVSIFILFMDQLNL